MSTKRKGKTGGVDLFKFVQRREIPQEVVDHFSLSLRLYREALLAKEGKLEMWTDLAGMLNVGGLRAQELKRDDWLVELNKAGDALKAISTRHDRVGGRIAATDAEAASISIGLNCLEEVWTWMTLQDFDRLASIIDAMNQHLKEPT